MLVFTILKAIECGKESLKKITELLEKKRKKRSVLPLVLYLFQTALKMCV